MTRIVTTSNRYKRPPRKRKAVALEVPAVVTTKKNRRPAGDRCGKDRMVNEAHTAYRDLPIRTILDRMRYDGCGGRAGRAELLTGIEGTSSRPVRKITPIEG